MLGLLFRALAPMRNRAAMRAVVEGIEDHEARGSSLLGRNGDTPSASASRANGAAHTADRRSRAECPPCGTTGVQRRSELNGEGTSNFNQGGDMHKRRPTLRATFHVMQEWEGHVLEIDGDQFVAGLVDLTAGSSLEEEEAIIPLAQITAEDATGLQVGTVFRWVIGYEWSSSGAKKGGFQNSVS